MGCKNAPMYSEAPNESPNGSLASVGKDHSKYVKRRIYLPKLPEGYEPATEC